MVTAKYVRCPKCKGVLVVTNPNAEYFYVLKCIKCKNEGRLPKEQVETIEHE